MTAVIILLVLGVALIIEAIFILKRTSARNRAAAGGAIGTVLGYQRARPGYKTAGAIFGGVGGSLFGALSPYISFTLGVMFLLADLIFLLNWDRFDLDRTTDCGNEFYSPSESHLIGNWKDYLCMNKKAAGTKWKHCLSRATYTETQGKGCPGDERCCPALSSNPTQVPEIEKGSSEIKKKVTKKKSKAKSSTKEKPVELEYPKMPSEPDPIDQYLRESPPSN